MAIVLLPDGEVKQSKYILKNIVICDDNSQYYWNIFSENIIFAKYNVNSIPPFILDKNDCGIVDKISYILSDVDYESIGNTIINPTGGTGEGLKIQITTEKNQKFILNDFDIIDQGTDYLIGDIIESSILGPLTVTSTSPILKNKIDEYDTTISSTLYDTPISSIMYSTTTSSTPSTFKISSLDSNMFEISNIEIINPGSGYNSTDIVTILKNENDPNDKGINLHIDVDYGNKGIQSFNIISMPQNGYTTLPQTTNLPSKNTTGIGSGATFSLSYTEKFQISNFNITSYGSGYSVGDIINFYAGTNNFASMTINEVSGGSGKILNFVTDSSVYNVPNEIKNYKISPTGGSGIGSLFVVNSTPTTVFKLSSISLIENGSGYSVGDILTTSYTSLDITVASIYKEGCVLTYNLNLIGEDIQNISSTTIPTTSNGNGTGFIATLICKTNTVYKIIDSSLTSGGSGFTVGEKFTTDYGNITINKVYNGSITESNISISTSTFVGTPPTTVSIPSPSGIETDQATLSISTNPTISQKYIPKYAVDNGGNCYTANYTLSDTDNTSGIFYYFIVKDSSGNNVGKLQINTTGDTGNILTVSYIEDIESFDSVFNVDNTVLYYISGTGKTPTIITTSVTNPQLATFMYTSIQTAVTTYKISSISVLDGGSNFTVGYSYTFKYGSISIVSVTPNGQVSDYSFDYNTNYISSNPLSITISSTTNDVAVLSLSWTSKNTYTPTSISISDGGTNYNVGDIITLGSYGTLTVTNAAKLGEIEKISYTDSLAYHHDDMTNNNVTTTSTSGSGAILSIVCSNTSLNVISSTQMIKEGYGYSVGDILSLGIYGKVTISSVDEGLKTIQDYSISYNTKSFTSDISQNVTQSYSGSGTGLAYTFTCVGSYYINGINLTSIGKNYNVGDILEIAGDYYSDGNYYSDGGLIKITGCQTNSQPVTNVTLQSKQILNTQTLGNITCSGGSGSGLIISLSYIPVVAHKISSIELVSSGISYNIGDVLQIGDYGSVTVKSLKDSGGNILGLKQNIKTIDSDKQIDMSQTETLSGGSGNGASIDIKYEKEEYYRISNIKILDGGYGYSVNDYVMVDNFQGLSITSIKNNI